MSAYQAILDVLEQGDEPHIAAREIIIALGQEPEEIRGLELERGTWKRVNDAMLHAAEAAIANTHLAAAAARIERWPMIMSELEAAGCNLLQFRNNPHRWRIEADGLEAELDLHTGELTGLDGTVVGRPPTVSPEGFHEVTWTMEELILGVAAGIQRRQEAVAKKIRRSAANENRR